MTTNNAGSWADEMDRTRPFSDSTESDGQPEGSLNPATSEVGKTTTNVVKPEGNNSGTEVQTNTTEVKTNVAESQSYQAEVRNIVAEIVNKLMTEVQIQNNPDTEVRNQSPEEARKVESAAAETRHVGANTEVQLDSVFTEVGRTFEHGNRELNYFIQDWINEVKEREISVLACCQTTTAYQRKVVALEIEVEDASKTIFDMEEKVFENEAKVARLLGDQASLRLDCLNLKRKQLEKSSQLRAARVELRESEDKSRQAHTDLMASLCGKALVASKTRAPKAAEAAATPEASKAAEAAPEAPKAAEAAPQAQKATEVATVDGAKSLDFPSMDKREKDRFANLKLPANFQKYVEWTATLKNKVGSSMGSKDPNLGRMAGGVYEEVAEVSLRVLELHPKMTPPSNRTHIRKEAMTSCLRALDNYACAKMWTSFQRVLDLMDLMTWEMSPEESAELNVVRLRIDIVNGDRGVAEVTAKNILDQAKAKKWRAVIAAASSVLSSIAWHNVNEN